MSVANTRECFTSVIGHKVVGVLFDAFPAMSPKLAVGTKTLIFDDGRGLTITSNGAFWIEDPRTVQRVVRQRTEELHRTAEQLGQVLDLAGLQLPS